MENNESLCFNSNDSSCPDWISLESTNTQICQDPVIITLSAVNDLLSTSPSAPTSSAERHCPTPNAVSVPYQDDYVFTPSNASKSPNDSEMYHEPTTITESSALNCLTNGTPSKMNDESKPEDESALSCVGFLDDQSSKVFSPKFDNDDFTLPLTELFPSRYMMPVTKKEAQLSPDIQSLPRRFDYDDYSLPLMELSPYKYLYQ